MKTTRKFTAKEIEVFEFLNVLRLSGATNMLFASPYITEEFGTLPGESLRLLQLWIENFNRAGYDHLKQKPDEDQTEIKQ